MAKYVDIDAVKEAVRGAECDADWDERRFDAEFIENALDFIPAADVAPVVHGRWEWFDEDTGTPITGYEREWGWRCTHCKEELSDDYDDPDCCPEFRFCPNCGAKMDGGDNDAINP